MPVIYGIRCPNCSLQMPGYGGHQYVIDQAGKRIVCGHPGEHLTIAEVLAGIEGATEEEIQDAVMRVHAWEAKPRFWWSSSRKVAYEARVRKDEQIRRLVDRRTGFEGNFICIECWSQFPLDVDRDPKVCPECASKAVENVFDMPGKLCPRCKGATIEKIDTGIVT